MHRWHCSHIIHSHPNRTLHWLYKLYFNTINYILLSITLTTISQLLQIGNTNTLFIPRVIRSIIALGLQNSQDHRTRSYLCSHHSNVHINHPHTHMNIMSHWCKLAYASCRHSQPTPTVRELPALIFRNWVHFKQIYI